MIKKSIRGCAWILGLSFILSSGCKKNTDKRQRVVLESDPYYSCEEVRLDLEFPETEGRELNNRVNGGCKVYSDRVLWYVEEEFVVPADLQKRYDERYLDLSMTDEDKIKLQEEYSSYRKSGIAVFDLNGKMINFINVDPPYNRFPCFSEDSAGNPKVALSAYTNGYYQTTFLYDVSAEGELINEIILEGETYGLSDIVFQENGNFLSYDQMSVFLFSPDGKLLNTEKFPHYVDDIFRIDGKYYVHMTVYDYYATSDEDEVHQYMQQIDPSSGKKTGELLDVDDWVAGDRLVQCQDGVYVVMGSGIRKIDVPGGQEPQKVLDWSETDCHYADWFRSDLNISSNNDIYITRSAYEWNIEESFYPDSYKTLLHYHREEKNPHAGKNILYLAYIDTLSEDFLRYLNTYNLDPDKKQRILIKDYSGQSAVSTPFGSIVKPSLDEKAAVADQVYLDILAGDGPDILLNFGSYSQFNTERALVDLNTLIDGDSPLDRSLYFDNIFRAYERNGKLYQMPMTFGVTGMVVNSDYVSERTGWTYDEFREISKTLPPDILMYNNVPQKELLETLMNGSFSHFLDYDGRKVNFEDPEFAGILDLVKTYGSTKSQGELDLEHDQDATGTVLNDMQKFIEGMLVAMNYSFSNLEQFAYIDGIGNRKAFFIGYPNAAGYGGKANNASSIAIARSCLYKDEAWDFLKYLLEDDYQMACARRNYLFPVNRKAFDACMDYGIIHNQLEWEQKEKVPDLVTDMIWYSIHIGQEHIDALKKVIENIHDSCSTDPSALMIIQEEAPGYFTGQRTLDDVVSIIQKRAAAVVQERG